MPIEERFRHQVPGMLRRKGLLTPERIRVTRSWEHSGFNVNAQARIGGDDAAGRENPAHYLSRAPFRHAPHAKSARANWARFIKNVFAADPLECPDCGGTMRIVVFIEDQRVVRAILAHLSLWDESRPPPAAPAAKRAPAELECLPG